MEKFFGADNYFVHFNRQPGGADAMLDQNTSQFLHDLYCKNVPLLQPEPGMMMTNLAQAETPMGEPILNEEELAVCVATFEAAGFPSSINWYRSMDRSGQIRANVGPVIHQPAPMIYGEQDMILKLENLEDFVPNVDVVSLDCGHWIEQEMLGETTRAMLEWLGANAAA